MSNEFNRKAMAGNYAGQYHFKSNYYVLYTIKHSSMDKKTTTLGYTTAGRGKIDPGRQPFATR